MVLCEVGLHRWRYKERGYFKHNRVCTWCGLYQLGCWSPSNDSVREEKYTDNPLALANYWKERIRTQKERERKFKLEKAERIRNTIVPWGDLK